MIDRGALTTVLRDEVSQLVDDLRSRADSVPEIRDQVEGEWRVAADAGRTAHDMETWREGLLAQIAVSWVLGCVFIRFCEDNRLVTDPMLSGTGDWRRWAGDAQVEFFRHHPDAGERTYLEHVFSKAAAVNGLAEVFGPHNPVWRFGPTDDACRALIALWRDTDPESGELVWDFTDPDWDTRFLGDLYQDLSEHAKKAYALLQTPHFVESFILDRTLDPAIEEFGLNGHDGSGFRMIDPACGSGHFLLGAFDRLAGRYLEKSPADGPRAAAARALDSIFGVDINAFAAAIARFRLLVAALRFAQVATLAEAPMFAINVAVGDSLLHGPPPGQLQGVLAADERQSDVSRHLYESEDVEILERFLGQDYHAVVANPPYITPKDPAANTAYRDRYVTCSGKYSLSVPFMERLFDLAVRGGDPPAGYVGQITANSFMKREFGRKVIREFLPTDVDLTHVIDTSGAYIPGHGTPTVILLGRNRKPVGGLVRGVLGVRGEPATPDDPATAKVWSSIVELVDQPGSENDFVSSVDLERSTLAKHPWSLQGGAAAPLKRILESDTELLGLIADSVGITAVTGEDSLYIVGSADAVKRSNLSVVRRLVVGDEIRNWRVGLGDEAVWPYDDEFDTVDPREFSGHEAFMWPFRAAISSRKRFGVPMLERGMSWFEWQEVYSSKLATPLSIAFAFVATHNHFVLDRGGKVFNRSAPVIKLAGDASVDDHLQLLGLLNSSVACFWLKQVCHNKGDSTDSQGARVSGVEAWVDSYEFDATKLKQFPVAGESVLSLARALDEAAGELDAASPESVADRGAPSREELAESERKTAELRSRMVWLQEELDWRCMFIYGATDSDLSSPADEAFPLEKGERAFEIALARKIANGDAISTWFDRHDSSPITHLPDHWPDWYCERVEERLALIESDRFVNLLERPEYKRRWKWTPWQELADDALRTWLLTRLEDGRYWPTLEPRSVAQLADIARTDPEFTQVAELYLKSPEVDLVSLIGDLAKSDAVPYLAAWRYKETGMRKRAAWERTWDLQRREDAGENVGKIPVPPKYASKDFHSSVYWTLRGKLDVPKERFVSYPGTERAADDTAVLGWAGWDHLQQAQALTTLYNQRANTEGWDPERLIPVLAGLAELVPWLRQWHNELDPSVGQGLGDYFADYLSTEMQRLGLSQDDLVTWRPPSITTRRRKKAKT